MANYDWEKIFKRKTEKELVDIYIGKSFLDFEAEIYAGLELQSRAYDFDKLVQLHHTKQEKLKQQIAAFEQLEFKSSAYFKKQIAYFIGLTILLILLITNSINTTFELYKALIYFTFFIVSILTSKWSYTRFAHKKEEALKRKNELLDRMSKTIQKTDNVHTTNQ